MKKSIFIFVLILMIMTFNFAGASINITSEAGVQNQELKAGVEEEPSWIAEFIAPDLQISDHFTLFIPHFDSDDSAASSFTLPSSLQYIDDEAFAGTAAERIELPTGVQEIGNRAFADNPNLKSVYIPESVTHISADAFAGSRQVIITAASGSYARKWASENAIPFTPAIVMFAGMGGTTAPVLSLLSGVPEVVIESGNIRAVEEKTDWKAVAEIAALKYEKCLANHVAGRSPPFVG